MGSYEISSISVGLSTGVVILQITFRWLYLRFHGYSFFVKQKRYCLTAVDVLVPGSSCPVVQTYYCHIQRQVWSLTPFYKRTFIPKESIALTSSKSFFPQWIQTRRNPHLATVQETTDHGESNHSCHMFNATTTPKTQRALGEMGTEGLYELGNP